MLQVQMQTQAQQEQQPAPQAEDLTEEDFERIMSSPAEFKRFLDKRDEQIRLQAVSTLDSKQSEQQQLLAQQQQAQALEAQMNKYLDDKYADFADPRRRGLVEAEVSRMGRDFAERAARGMVTPEDALFWAEVKENPTKVIDAAVNNLRALMDSAREEGVKQAAQKRERMPDNPVAPSGGSNASVVEEPHETPEDYIRNRLRGQAGSRMCFLR